MFKIKCTISIIVFVSFPYQDSRQKFTQYYTTLVTVTQ